MQSLDLLMKCSHTKDKLKLLMFWLSNRLTTELKSPSFERLKQTFNQLNVVKNVSGRYPIAQRELTYLC